MLRADKVTVRVGRKLLVDSISAELEPGKLHFILGPNGAGKSTLLKLLSGQAHADEGDVQYGDRSIRHWPLPRLARVRAVLSQNIEIAFPLRVREVVRMGRYPHFAGRPGPADERACDEVMQLFDIADLAGRDYLTLSGGEQQRVHFARVLAQIWYPIAGEDRYLFLDEPLTFLDIYYQLELMKKLEALRRPDLVIVGVVHDLNLAARFGDRLLLLHAGRLIASGAVEAVLTREHVEAAFRVAPTLHKSGGRLQLGFE